MNIFKDIFKGPAYDKYSAERTRAYTKSPSRLSYNIDANKAAGQFIQDRTKELLGDNPVSNAIGQRLTYSAVPLAFMASPFHEGAQVVEEGRMEPGSGIKGFYNAFMDEDPLITAAQRAAGVLQSTPLGEAIYNIGGKTADLVSGIRNTNIGDLFFTPTSADDDKITQAMRDEVDITNQLNDYYEKGELYNIDDTNKIPGFTDKIKSGIETVGNKLGSVGDYIKGGGIINQALQGLGNAFEYRGGMGYVDEYGNFISAEELDQQNARGGYYTDAARASRRRDSAIQRMLQRREEGKRISEANLEKYRKQQAKEEAARQAAFNEIMSQGNNQQDFYDSLNQGSGSTAVSGNPNTSGAGDAPGYSGPSTFKRGGIVNL